MSISYSTAYEIVSRKILINKMSIELLVKQTELCKVFKKIQDILIAKAHDKIRLTHVLNNVFEDQLREFSSERQNYCIEIYEKLHNIDTLTKDEISIYNSSADLDVDIKLLYEKIKQLENTIPKESLVTNFKI